ncbi:MAG: heavy metal-binding domain-containing protein [Bacteroidales bacterium]|nr:heavy metal-binding domain-containing protein [Bacteroidales bacterium]
MILSTTPTLEGHRIKTYYGVVTGETIIGANFLKDFTASLHDFFGGRSNSYESTLREAKDIAMKEMSQRAAALGANAVVGIDIDYETVGQSGSMLMVSCSGTAVSIE